MANIIIEDAVNALLKGEMQKNALDLIAYLRADDKSEDFTICTGKESYMGKQNVFDVLGLGKIIVAVGRDSAGEWGLSIDADNLGQFAEQPIDEQLKEFAWENIVPCTYCVGEYCQGEPVTVFGKVIANVCFAKMWFPNPDTETLKSVKKIIDIRQNDIRASKMSP